MTKREELKTRIKFLKKEGKTVFEIFDLMKIEFKLFRQDVILKKIRDIVNKK